MCAAQMTRLGRWKRERRCRAVLGCSGWPDKGIGRWRDRLLEKLLEPHFGHLVGARHSGGGPTARAARG